VRSGLFGSLATLLVAASLGMAQAPAPSAAAAATSPEMLPPPRQPSAPSPAPDSLPPPMQAPPAVAPQEAGSLLDGGACGAGWRLCGASGLFWVDAEYLLWWTKGMQLPALATIGSTNDMPPGAFGQPSTVEVLGDRTVDTNVRSGARFTAGLWICNEPTLGVEGNVFFLEPHATRMAASSNGSVLLARPFFAVGNVTLPDGTTQTLAQEDALIVASPGVSSGSVRASTSNRFWGAEANARLNLCGDCFYRVDLLAGFRYLELKDNLSIVSVSDTIPPSGPTTVADLFRTVNHFYGAQVGAAMDFCRGPWYLDFRGKFALGSVTRAAVIEGSTTTTANGTNVVPGGLFAQSTNIGRHTNTAFGVVPELGARVGYRFTRYLQGYAGYSFLYLARNVAQPGDQIDRAVNVNLIPSLAPASTVRPVHPAFAFQNTDFWAQGFVFGVELSF
jgi:hypothetical protein